MIKIEINKKSSFLCNAELSTMTDSILTLYEEKYQMYDKKDNSSEYVIALSC